MSFQLLKANLLLLAELTEISLYTSSLYTLHITLSLFLYLYFHTYKEFRRVLSIIKGKFVFTR